MNDFKSIVGFNRVKYLPRLGKIRLGVKLVSKKSGKEYPKEVEYFVVPPEVARIYGEKPTRLDVMFPSDNPEDVIPYCYKSYSSNKRLRCKGNGEVAVYYDAETKGMVERKCPCDLLEQKKCGRRGHLMVILPKVSFGGCYQIDSGSGRNINTVLNTMEYYMTMVGRCRGLLLTLERVPEKMPNPADETMQTHYMLRFGTDLNIDLVNKAIENKTALIDYKVQAPVEDGALDDTPVVWIEDDVPDAETIPETGPQAPTETPRPATQDSQERFPGEDKSQPFPGGFGPPSEASAKPEQKGSPKKKELITDKQVMKIQTMLTTLGIGNNSPSTRKVYINSLLKSGGSPTVDSMREISKDDASTIIDIIQKSVDERKK